MTSPKSLPALLRILLLACCTTAVGCASPTADDEEDHPLPPDDGEVASVEGAVVAPDPPPARSCTNWVELHRVNATSVYVRYHTGCPSKAFLLSAQGYTTRNGMVLCSRTANVNYTAHAVTPWCPLWDPAGTQYWGFVSEGSMNADDQIPRYGFNSRF